MTDDRKFWLIYSRKHNMFWRHSESGYTDEIKTAGRYTKKQADSICNSPDRCPGGGPDRFMLPAPESIVLLYGRDRLWCRAIVETLDIQQMEKVFTRFNTLDIETPTKRTPGVGGWDYGTFEYGP